MDLDNIQRKYGLPAPLPVVQNGKFAPRFPLNLEHRGDDVFQFGGKYIGEIENIYDLLYKILTNQEIDASLALPYAIKITEDKLYIRDKTNSEWILIFDITKPNFPKEIELYELIYKAITHQVIGEDTSYPGQFKIEENILYVRDKDNLTWTQIGDVTKEFLGATEATQAILDQVNEILTEVQELKTELNRQIATTNETLTTALQAANEAMTSAQSINIRTFNSVEEMKASNTLKAGALAKTQGFYTAGDGGGADYLITDNIGEDENEEASIITLQNSLYAKLLVQDYVNVKQMGAKGDNETDDTQALQKAIDYVLKNTGTLFFPPSTYYVTSSLNIVKGGEARITICGVGATIATDQNIDVLIVKGEEQGKRISQIEIKDLYLTNTTFAVGRGIVLMYYGAEVRVKRVRFFRFNYGYYVSEGSEAIFEGIESAGNNFGGYYGAETYPPNIDSQATYFLNCYMHDNSVANIIVNNALELYIIGGSWMSVIKDTHGGIYIDNSVASNITIRNVDFEQSNAPTVYCKSIIRNLVFAENQVAPSVANKDVIYLDSGNTIGCVLTIEKNILDSKMCNWVHIGENVIESFTFSLKNNSPFSSLLFKDERINDKYNVYNILDNIIYKYKKELSTLNYGLEGWGADGNITLNGEETSLTGSVIYKISSGYIILDGNVEEGNEYIIDITAKATDVNKIVGFVETYPQSSQNPIISITGVPNCIVHTYTNGFSRVIHKFKATSRGQLRLTNQWSLGEVLIERIDLYCSVNKSYSILPKLTAMPSVGTHSKGDIVYNSNPTAGGNLGWVCITAGSPGIWKSFGNIQS